MAAETVIESFCERCGTRYTFEPVRKRESKLVGLGKTLGILLGGPRRRPRPRRATRSTARSTSASNAASTPARAAGTRRPGSAWAACRCPSAPDTAALDAAEAEAGLEAAVLRDQARAEHELLGAPEAWPDADLLHRAPRPRPGPRRRSPPKAATVPADEVSAESAAEDASVVEPEDEAWSLTFEPEPLTEAPRRSPDRRGRRRRRGDRAGGDGRGRRMGRPRVGRRPGHRRARCGRRGRRVRRGRG